MNNVARHTFFSTTRPGIFLEESIIVELTTFFLWKKSVNEQRLYTVRQQTKFILHGESAMHDYLNGDIDSSCGSLSREDPMLFGIPRRVVPPLIICDSSVRDAQMTRYFTKKKARRLCFKRRRLFQTFQSNMSEFNLIMWNFKMLLNTVLALTLCTYKSPTLCRIKQQSTSIRCIIEYFIIFFNTFYY